MQRRARACAWACLGMLAALPAQQSVRLQHAKGGSELERVAAGLLLEDQRPAAMLQLWRAGEPAIQILVATVARGDDAAPAALQVLAAFGGEARSALPQLQRLAAPGGHRCQLGLELAIAAIGERDSVLLSQFGNAVIELDGAGQELRRVPCQSVWGVRPLPGDRLLVTTLPGVVAEIDWQGKVHWSVQGLDAPLDARRLPDGTTIVACWNGYVARFDAGGKQLWRRPEIRAVDIEPLWNGHFLAVGHEDKQLVELDGKGEVVWRLPLPDPPMDVDMLPNGNLLVAFDRARRIDEYTREGKVVASSTPPADPEDVHRLGDGRSVIADDQGVVMLAKDGKVLWRFQVGHAGHVVARLARAESK